VNALEMLKWLQKDFPAQISVKQFFLDIQFGVGLQLFDLELKDQTIKSKQYQLTKMIKQMKKNNQNVCGLMDK
jgi:hypothetical protein